MIYDLHDSSCEFRNIFDWFDENKIPYFVIGNGYNSENYVNVIILVSHFTMLVHFQEDNTPEEALFVLKFME